MGYTESWSGKINRKLRKKLHIIDVAAGREKADLVPENAKAAAYSLGVGKDIDPFMTLSFMSLPVIPTLRLTTRGVIDVTTQQYI